MIADLVLARSPFGNQKIVEQSILNEIWKVSEIFYSIAGEGSLAGMPMIFIRLSGCNLRCDFCDTKYAWEGGKEMAWRKIKKEAKTTFVYCDATIALPLIHAALLERAVTASLERAVVRDDAPGRAVGALPQANQTGRTLVRVDIVRDQLLAGQRRAPLLLDVCLVLVAEVAKRA